MSGGVMIPEDLLVQDGIEYGLAVRVVEVIEAARAWKKDGGGQSQVPSAAEARLWEKLQALDSEEGSDE